MRQRAGGPFAAAQLGQVLGGEIPIGEIREEGLEEIRAPVLVIEIIGVLPHVAGEQRHQPERDRVDRIGGFDDFQLAAVQRQPHPAAAELANPGLDEVVLEIGQAAELVFDPLGEFAGGLAAALLLHAVPEEFVVPGLGGVVENRRLGAVLGGETDDLLQRFAGQGGARDQLVQRVDIGAVVLVVMKLESLGGDMRLERILRIGQRRKFKGHRMLPFMTEKPARGRLTVSGATNSYPCPMPRPPKMKSATSTITTTPRTPPSPAPPYWP